MTENFLGSVREDNDACANFVSAMFKAFRNIDVRISIKLDYLHLLLQIVSDQHGERFH